MSRASFKTFVAAAGVGGISYWIDEIVPDNNDVYATRLAFNDTRNTIMLVGVNQNDGKKQYIQLDHDGSIERESKTGTMSGAYSYQSVAVQRGMNEQYITIDEAGVYQMDPRILNDSSSGTIQTQDMSISNDATGGLAYYATGYMNPRHTLYSDDDYVLVAHGGYITTYFTGYGTYFRSNIIVRRFTYTSSGTVTSNGYVDWDFGYEPYSDSRYIAVSPQSSSGYHLVCGWVYTGFGASNMETWNLYRGTTNTGTATSKATQQGSGMVGMVGIEFDSNEHFIDVRDYTNDTRVFKNTLGPVPTYYWPNTRYDISLGTPLVSSSARPIDTAIDSNDNLYILYSTGHIAKWSSAMVLQWTIKVENTAAAPYSATAIYNGSLDIRVIDETDVIFVTLTQAQRSGQTTKNIAVYKLPIDLNNYTGTYGDYSITSVSSAFNVSTLSPSISLTGGGFNANTQSMSSFTSASVQTPTTLSVTNTPV